MESTPPEVIDAVRSLMPTATLYLLGRPLTEPEARILAERQAIELLELLHISRPSVEIERIMTLPDIEVEVLSGLPWSGYSSWQDDHWHIQINADDSLWRCRASLAHEFKHILDDPYREELYPNWPHGSTDKPPRQAESIAEYFAGCVLAPTAWLKNAWQRGTQDIAKLASLFDVSEALIRVRLQQVGLANDSPHIYTRHAYKRSSIMRKATKKFHRYPSQQYAGAPSCA